MSENKVDYVLFGIDFKLNEGQREIIRLIREDPSRLPLLYVMGAAGTGKTFAVLAAALSLIRGKGAERKYKNIYYVREPVEIGHRLGYLKGTEEDKFAPYLGGLLDNYSHLMNSNPDATQQYLNKYRRTGEEETAYASLPSDIIPLAPEFVRGRSFEDAIIIVDEAQNMNLDELQTLTTRLGNRTKMIIIGSPNQIDVPGMDEDNNDFLTSYKILEPTGLVKMVKLEKPMRSSFVADFDLRFCEYKRNHPKYKNGK